MKTKLLITLLVTTILLASLSMAMSASDTMTRTPSSTSVSPGSSFTLTYTAQSTAPWGASIEESASGGCTFPSGSSTYKTVMLSEDGNTKTITMTAPASGSCTISGNYKYGSFDVKNFNSITITVQGNCPEGQTKCSDGTCKVSCECTGTGCTECTDGTLLGTFCLKWWMLGIAVGLIILFFVFKKK